MNHKPVKPYNINQEQHCWINTTSFSQYCIYWHQLTHTLYTHTHTNTQTHTLTGTHTHTQTNKHNNRHTHIQTIIFSLLRFIKQNIRLHVLWDDGWACTLYFHCQHNRREQDHCHKQDLGQSVYFPVNQANLYNVYMYVHQDVIQDYFAGCGKHWAVLT